MGVERILTFEHLIYLNQKASTAPPDGIADEHAFDRNRVVLAFILAGTLYEMGDALQELCSTGIAADLRETESWQALNKLRAEWNTAEYASMIRNNFAFHLGDQPDYVSGIASIDDDPVLLFESRGSKRFAGRFHAPWNALFRALNVKNEDIDDFARSARDAHVALPDLVIAFFAEVINSKGVASEAIDVEQQS